MDVFEHKVRAGQPMLDEALRACRAYEEAKGVKPTEESSV